MKSRKLLAVLLAITLIFSSLSCVAFAAKEKTATFKNVIIMIGDGMGPNHLEWTKADKGVQLYMDTMPYRGYRTTNSLNGLTDSAAGGTTLSCGYRAFNSNIGTLSVLMNGQGFTVATYKSITEIAHEMGKKTGIVTSDVNSGATPASFSAHTTKRELAEEITEQQLKSDLDLIWSASSAEATEDRIVKAGWEFIDDIDEIKDLKPGTKSFAQFEGKVEYKTGEDNDAPLSELTSLAIENLDNDEGFFLMVEGAHIDKNSHSNIKEGMVESVIEFDKAIENAVEWAKEDGETLVIVSADHETGGITYNKDKQTYEFTTGNHTEANVPLLVYGTDRLVTENGQVVDCLIPCRFAVKEMGYTGRFPQFKINPLVLIDFFKALGKLIAA